MDSRPPSVTIISLLDSTQNHKESLADLARQVDRALSGYEYELILVTEDIPNRTETTFEPLADKYPIKLVRSTGKVGPTVLAELKEARGQVIGIIENEPQRSIERIPQLLDALEKGADIAIASRYVPGGAIKGRNTGQKLLSSITTSLTRLVLPSVRRARDPLSGLFMLRKAVAEDLGQTTPGPRILLGGKAGSQRQASPQRCIKQPGANRGSSDQGKRTKTIRTVWARGSERSRRKHGNVLVLHQNCRVEGSRRPSLRLYCRHAFQLRPQ